MTKEADDLDLRPMEPPSVSLKQASLAIDAPTPEFGRPLVAPKARSSAKPKASPVDEDQVGDYRHADATRTNIPEAGLATQDRLPTDRVTSAYDRIIGDASGVADMAGFLLRPGHDQMAGRCLTYFDRQGITFRAIGRAARHRGSRVMHRLDSWG